MKMHFWRYTYIAVLLLWHMMPLAHARETSQGTVIYEQTGLEVTVYGFEVQAGGPNKKSIEDFCFGKNKTKPSSYHVSVWYGVPHRERSKLIAPGYEDFVKEKIYPNLIKLCGNITVTEITMRMANFGDTTRDKWSETMIFKIDNDGKSIIKTRYIPNKVARANMSLEEMEALMPGTSSSAPENMHRPDLNQLYSDGKITIYENGGLWCYPKGSRDKPVSGAGLDIIVPVSYNELQGWLRSNYGAFESTIIKPLFDKHCRMGNISVKFYQSGQDQYLEHVRYGWGKNTVQGGLINPFAKEQFMVLGRQAGYTSDARMAEIKKEKAIMEIWGEPCNGVLCVLPGGAYFQAILNGNLAAVKKMDAKYTSAVIAKLKKTGAIELARLFGGSDQSFVGRNYSLLPLVANRYFYQYKDHMALQCSDNLVSKTYTYQHAMHEMPDYNGMAMPDMGGEVDSATYYLRPEFVQVCDQVCNAWGYAYDGLVTVGTHKPSQITLNAVSEFMSSQDCASKTIKTFEKNLVAYTQKYLDNKKQWLQAQNDEAPQSSSAPDLQQSTATKPTVSKPRVEPPIVQQGKRTRSANPLDSNVGSKSVPAHSTKKPTPKQTANKNATSHSAATQSATSQSAMSTAERYEQMNAEIAALSEKYTKRLNRLSAAFKKNMQRASSSTERTSMLTEYQTKMADLSAEAQRETQKIKERYKSP